MTMSLATPVYNLKSFPNVYEPSEDSFLLLDALEMDLDLLKRQQTPMFAAEIGSGSGIAITALAVVLGSNCTYFATDINPEACAATCETAKINKTTIDVLNMNLLDNFRNTFDIILFNPPYVITDGSEMLGSGLNRSWAGGNNGRETIDKLLSKLPSLLSENGVCYIVLLKENRPEIIVEQMRHLNICSEKIIERRIRGEHLYVYKFKHE